MTGETTVQAKDVVVRDAGKDPAAVAEVVRAMTGITAAEAKQLIATTPCTVRARVSPALAEALRGKLVAVGASVEVRGHGATEELFDVVLQAIGASRADVVRALRATTGRSPAEASELLARVPCVIKPRLRRDAAATIVHEFLEAGARAELRAHAPEPPAAGALPATIITRTAQPATIITGPPPVAPTPTDEYAVILQSCGRNKIAAIKAIREVTGLGLREAKELAETDGATIKRGLGADEAASIARALTEVGATVEVRGSGESVAAAAPEETDPSTLVDVVLTACGTNKILVIKEVRGVTNLGLKDAKDLVESAPAVIKEGMEAGAAKELAARLLAAGAKVELR